MNKSYERKKYNSYSEIKINDNNMKNRKEVKALLNKKSNKTPHSICFYLINYFYDNHYHSSTLNELSKYILNIYKTNPQNLVTNYNEVYKDTKYVKTSFRKILNNKVFTYNSNESTYKLNESEALLYLKSQPNGTSLAEKEKIKNYKTPNKLSTRRKKILQLEESKETKNYSHNYKMKYNLKNNNIKREKVKETDDEDDNKIKIKKEEVNIKEEEKAGTNDEKIKIKKEEVNIKEEAKIKEEKIEDEELSFDRIIELFNGKLYDNFYLSFAEQGLFEQLQEKIDTFLEKYSQNNLDKNNNNNSYYSNDKLSGIISKIKQMQELINDLNTNKEKYDKLIVQFEQSKNNLNFYIRLLSFKYNEIKYAKEITENLDFDTQDIDKDAKELYIFDKNKHDLVYNEIINTSKDIKNIIQKSDENKNSIKKELFEIVNYLNANNIRFEDINNLFEIEDTFKNEKKSSFKREYVTDKIIQSYNKHLREFEEKMKKIIS